MTEIFKVSPKRARRTNRTIFYVMLVLVSIIFLASPIFFRVFEIEILPSQFVGALFGVFITAIVTAFLLRGQTEGDEKREKSIKVFEKKQEVYHSFLEKFQKIIQDGDKRLGMNREDGSVDNSTDEIKDLIFQLAFIQMHTSTENTKKVLSCIADIKHTINGFNETKDEQKNTVLEKFYSDLSEKLFEIVAILKSDLYPDPDATVDSIPKAIPKVEMEQILKKFDLYAEVKNSDKYEIQTNFWKTLCKMLKEKGYNVDEKDFKQLVIEYYAGKKYCGTGLEVEEGLWLCIDSDKDNFFYGFSKGKVGEEDKELDERIRNTSPLFKSDKWWFGRKTPDKYNLDFWSFTSSNFEKLKHPRKKDIFIQELADEIDSYVKKFKETAK